MENHILEVCDTLQAWSETCTMKARRMHDGPEYTALENEARNYDILVEKLSTKSNDILSMVMQARDRAREVYNAYRTQCTVHGTKDKDINEIMHRLDGEILAYNAVLNAFDGKMYLLECAATGHIMH